MIRAVFTAAVIALATALPARAIDIQVTTSPGGIESWLVEDHSIPFTALTIMFRGGASVDPPGGRGAINLMTGLLEEGAADMDATAFAEAVEATGAVFRFDASDEAVAVTARLLTETRDEAAGLLAAALTEPRFDDDAVGRVKGQVEAIIRQEDTDPGTIAQKALARAAWGQHPLGSSINGTLESVAAIGPEELRAAKARVMARDRVVVAAAGDIDAKALGALVDRVLGGLPPEATVPLPPKVAPALGGGAEVIDWRSPQTVVAFAQPGLALDDPDFFPALVANYVLGGGGFSSRLTDEIREKRGLTYGVGTGLSNGLFGDIWAGGMSSGNESVAEAVELVRAEWRRIAEGGVTPEELETAKTYLTGEYPLRFDGNGKIAGILGGMQLMGMPPDYVNTRNPRIEAVTLEDVARVARTRIDPEALTFVLVGQPEGL
ncbi:insulinase family protein [Paracoccus sp. S-4012]|uniref:M16 family metallopeptidase n=1 Tax=Paracoccus sp. S-4012 TaxID=2665648 RepID=UPI0012B15BBB|nr:pitrilysin family protein [Paracoccus sp. S-4012]MRX49792.1 insulinase family protein [Paracoccus sp. S-4012]